MAGSAVEWHNTANSDDEMDGDGDWKALLGGGDPLEFERPDHVDEEDDEEVDPSSGAPALLAAVKERLAQSGRSSEYHDFLTAVSAATVDAGAALTILRGFPDLAAAFRRCFRAETVAVPKAKPAEDVPEADRRGADARAQQLAHLLFSNKVGNNNERTQLLDYLRTRAAMPAFPRRLFIMRGPPAIGKSSWAQKHLQKEIDSDGENNHTAHLAHICSTDDFFTQHVGASQEARYIFNPRRLAANSTCNEARVRLAMEAGIEPLYVDNANIKVWEMQPYVAMAERFGYVVTVVAPNAISESWNDLELLISRQDARKRTDKHFTASRLEAILGDFESLPDGESPESIILKSQRPAEEHALGTHSTMLPPSALLYKLDMLLLDGDSLMQYSPPDGQGWGVNGECRGEWHSFREKSDGTCTYEDEGAWETEAQESSWSFIELTMLEDLRKQVQELPKADLPSAVSHPGLFVQKKGRATLAALVTPPAGVAAPATPPADAVPMSRAERFKKRAGHGASAAVSSSAAADVPMSRRERFKHRASQVKEEEYSLKPQRLTGLAAQAQARAAAAAEVFEEVGDVDAWMPTAQEEMSASAFLAAVKARLTEWGKSADYHAFVMAISGTVDAKKAVKILRGHDDLLRIFRSKFAPRADLAAIKAEIQEEDDADKPHAPSTPAPRHRGSAAGPHIKQESFVKQEVDARGHQVAPSTVAGPRSLPGAGKPKPVQVKSEAGGPRPPAFGPGVKAEVKAELYGEDAPRPPPRPPSFNRPVTIGDDSDNEMDEATIAAAVRKGRAGCIAELAKIIFQRERMGHEGARERMSLVHYATKVASKPRFPREMIILRGAAGVGKTEFAQRQLKDYADFDKDEELAAHLTHICAVDDFFETYKAGGPVYEFKSHKLESAYNKNEARARLAMEAGIHPLYIDCSNLRVWEMKPYVVLAERLGYVTTVLEPHDICQRWDDLEFVSAVNDTTDRKSRGKVVDRSAIAGQLKAFEHIEDPTDPCASIRASHRQRGPRTIDPVDVAVPKGNATWMTVNRKLTAPAQANRAGKGKGKGGNAGKPAAPAAVGVKRPVPSQAGAAPPSKVAKNASVLPTPPMRRQWVTPAMQAGNK